MTKDNKKRALQGFAEWLGDEPDEIVEVRSGDKSVTVQYFVDDEDEDEVPTTYIATAGLCERAAGWAPGGAELLLCVAGDFEPEELEPLGQLVGHLALALEGAEAEPSPGLMLEVGPLPVFEGMTCLMLTRWSEEGGELTTTPPIQILSVNPLYEEEAAELAKMPEEEAMGWLDERGVDVDDPMRDSVFASEFAAASEKTMAAFNSQSSFEIASAMQQMGGSVASWLSAAAPGFFDQFGAEKAPESDRPKRS